MEADKQVLMAQSFRALADRVEAGSVAVEAYDFKRDPTDLTTAADDFRKHGPPCYVEFSIRYVEL